MLLQKVLPRFKLDKFKISQRNVSYIQGQEPEPKIREYFYYIDHEGMVRQLSGTFLSKSLLSFFVFY